MGFRVFDGRTGRLVRFVDDGKKGEEMTQSVRLKIIENMRESLFLFGQKAGDYSALERMRTDLEKQGLVVDTDTIVRASNTKVIELHRIIEDLQVAKVLVFPAGQAGVFMEAIGKIDFPLEYKLPFPRMLLQFSEPISIKLLDHQDRIVAKKLGAILLVQEFDGASSVNLGFLIEDDLRNFRFFYWDSEWEDPLPSHSGDDNAYRKTMLDIKNLSIACVGYINCENVYLHIEGGTDEATNRRRVSKGKSRLEPYYVCRIRGVQYDSAGNPTGEGAKHGIRYDVRGHFRRMTNGKTTWVRPHQRGLANELYVPKTYVVDRIDS